MNSLNSRRKKGFRAERELMELFKKLGFWGARIPVSAVGQPLPDILIFHNRKVIGVEVKSTKSQKLMLYKKDFDNLLEWLENMVMENFNAQAWIGVRFRGGIWRFYRVREGLEKITCDKNSGYALVDLAKKIRGFDS